MASNGVPSYSSGRKNRGSNIIEEGNHEELIKKQGIYYQLYTSAGEAEQN